MVKDGLFRYNNKYTVKNDAFLSIIMHNLVS